VVAEIKPIAHSMQEVLRDGNDYRYTAYRQYDSGLYRANSIDIKTNYDLIV